MSERERLIEIVRILPPMKVRALLAAAEQMTDYVSDEEFLRNINVEPAIDADEETAAELRGAWADRGATLSHEELKRELGLG